MLRGSRDNIRKKPIFDQGDSVFELELLLFEPPYRELVGCALFNQSLNGLIQIAVLALEDFKLNAQHVFILHREVIGGIHKRADSIWAKSCKILKDCIFAKLLQSGGSFPILMGSGLP